MPPATTEKKSQKKSYRRGGADHYASLARKSVDSRIKRHIEAEVVLDKSRVTSIPLRKRETDAGYDIATPQAVALAPREQLTVEMGVHVKCPPGYFYDIRGRSSLNGRVQVTNDVIDATYTGVIRVRLTNLTDDRIAFKVGDRIAQLIFLPQIHVKFKEVPAFKVQDGERGEAGFGSTGI